MKWILAIFTVLISTLSLFADWGSEWNSMSNLWPSAWNARMTGGEIPWAYRKTVYVTPAFTATGYAVPFTLDSAEVSQERKRACSAIDSQRDW